VDYASRDEHRYFRFNQGGYSVVVVTPKIGQRPTRPPLVPILVGFALFLILSGYLAVRALFLPVATIRQGAAYIGAGHFGHRIKTGRSDELGELADDINRMAGKVEGMLDAKRQLLLGVSHELRSPLSRMTLALALLDDSTAVRGLKQDVDEMRSIVDSLLDAERLGSAHTALNLEDVALDALVADLVARYFPDNARLQVDVPAGLTLRGDPARIQLLLKNLVGNALRYAPPESGAVDLNIRADAQAVEFRVRDRGPGLSPEQREHLGEPFYRADSSRARETGGTGLGLHLARQVARAHGGDLQYAAADPGAAFTVRLPRRG
jgi:signal transduction histidine kinase